MMTTWTRMKSVEMDMRGSIQERDCVERVMTVRVDDDLDIGRG